jgi:hypothetical protein
LSTSLSFPLKKILFFFSVSDKKRFDFFVDFTLTLFFHDFTLGPNFGNRLASSPRNSTYTQESKKWIRSNVRQRVDLDLEEIETEILNTPPTDTTKTLKGLFKGIYSHATLSLYRLPLPLSIEIVANYDLYVSL